MASINDKFIKTSVVEPTRLRDPLSSSATTLTVESTAGWNGDTAILAVIDRVDSAGNLTPDKMEIVIGTMNAGGLEQLRRGVGGRAQVHSSGAVVELSIAGSEQWNRAMDALISAFGQNGKIKESAFASGSQVVDGSVIKDGSIEPVKLKKVARTKDSKGWTISITPDGRKRWLISGSTTVGCNGNAWSEANLTDKPAELIGVDLSTNYIIQASVSTNDAALVCWFDAYSIDSNDNTLRVKLRNPHTSRLDRPTKYFITIEELL